MMAQVLGVNRALTRKWNRDRPTDSFVGQVRRATIYRAYRTKWQPVVIAVIGVAGVIMLVIGLLMKVI